MHIIAAKAVCLKEAAQPEFREYQKQVVRQRARRWPQASRSAASASSAAARTITCSWSICYSRGLTGKDAQPSLDRAGITVNKNSIPFDPTPPMTGGGIRLGTPAVTTRGMREPEMDRIAGWIGEVLGASGRRRHRAAHSRRSRGVRRRSSRSTRGAGKQRTLRRRAARRALSARRCAWPSTFAAPATTASAPTSATSSTSWRASTTDSQYLLIGQQRHLDRIRSAARKFPAARIPARARLLAHAPALALAAAQARRGRSAHAVVLCAGHRACAAGDHRARPDRRADAAGRRVAAGAGRTAFLRAAGAGARRPHLRRLASLASAIWRACSTSRKTRSGGLQRRRRALPAAKPLPADADRILERHAVNSPYVLYAGNIKPQKNLPRLIEAFAVAKEELRDHPEFAQLKLLVIGEALDAPRRSAARRRARAGARGRALPGIRAATGAARFLRARPRLPLPFPVRRLRPAAARGHGPRNARC